MTRRMLANTVVAAALLAPCFVCTIARSAAEPIRDADSGLVTGTTTPSQEESDAVARFKERDFDGALKLLQEMAKKNPDLPPAQVLMAQLFSRANLTAGMRSALEQAVIEEPDDPEAYLDLGDIAMRERRVTEAELVYQKGSGLLAKFNKSAKRKEILQPMTFSGLAAVAEARANWASAQKQLEGWLKFDAKSAPARQRLARCKFQQKDAAGSLEMLKEAAKLDREMLTPEAILAGYYEQVGDRDNAKKWMATALKLAPKDLKTRLAASQWAMETGQLEEAQAQADAALKLDPKSLEALILRSAIALFQNDYAAAESFSEKAQSQSPSIMASSNNLALALVEQKERAKRQRALEFAENNVKLYPKSAEAASTYGWVLYNLGKLSEAERALEAAVSAGQLTPDTAYYMARVYVDRGREKEAKQFLEAALKSTAPFSNRKKAKALLDDLKK